MDNGKKIRRSMVEDVVDYISNQLVNGTLKPNDKLPSEFEMAAQLSVSRNTVREAIKILTYLGIVEIRRADGTYICGEASPKLLNPIIYAMMYHGSSEEMLLELREMIEVGAVQRAIRKGTDEELRLMSDAVEEFKRICQSDDPKVDEVLEIDNKIHDIILLMGHNVLAEEISRIVYIFLEKRRRTAVQAAINKQSLMLGYDSHVTLYNLIKDKNEDNILKVVPQTFFVGDT